MRCHWLLLPLILVLLLNACTLPDPAARRREGESHLLLGRSLLQENNPSKAIHELLQAEQLIPEDPMVHAALAQAYWTKEAYDLAEQEFKKTYELSGHQPQYLNNLGALYLSLERYDEAIKAFTTAANDLTFEQAEVSWTGIGYANFQLKDYAAAERAYKKAISLNSRYYQAQFRLGEFYYAQERPVEAVKAFEAAVSLVPNALDGQYWLGLANMKSRNEEQAAKAFRAVIRIAPESEQAGLARNYLKIIQ